MITLTVKAEIEIPKVPNFFRMTDGQLIPVCAIEDEGLKKIGAAWLQSLRENAKRQLDGELAGDERKL